MVVGCLSPGAEGIIIIVGLAGAVLAAHQFLGFLGADSFAFHEAPDAVLFRGGDKDVQAVHLPQDVVCAAADENGVAAFGYGLDNLALDAEQHVVVDIAAVHVAQPAGSEEAGKVTIYAGDKQN